MTKYRLCQLFGDTTKFFIYKITNGCEKLVAEFGVNEMPIMIEKFKDLPKISERLKAIAQYL